MSEVYFRNGANLRLSGRLEYPSAGEKPYPIVVFSHGFDSSKDSPRGLPVAFALREAGLATFLFDFTGHGDSQGTKVESTIERQVDDLKSAIDGARESEMIDAHRIGVAGASSGGLVALEESLLDARVKSLSLRGPRTDGLIQSASAFKVPIQIIQGELDPLSPDTRLFINALDCPKRLDIIDGADHLFSLPEQLEQVVELTTAWFKETLIYWESGRKTA